MHFKSASCQGRCLLQIFEIYVLSCDLLVNLCPYNNSLGGAEDKPRKQVSNMSSFYIQKKAFIEGYLLIDFSVCLFDAYLISHSTASSHAVSRIWQNVLLLCFSLWGANSTATLLSKFCLIWMCWKLKWMPVVEKRLLFLFVSTCGNILKEVCIIGLNSVISIIMMLCIVPQSTPLGQISH